MSSSTACVNCGFVDSGRFCSGCGAELNGSAAKPMAKAIGGPFYEYFHHAAVSIRPARLVAEVKEGRLRFAGAVQFASSAGALLLVFAWVLHQEGSKPLIPEMPGLTEPLLALLAVFYLVCYAPAHWCLNMGARSVTYRQFAITTLCVWALFMPWIFIGVVAPFSLIGTAMMLAGTIGFTVAAVRSYALLYGRSVGGAFGLFLLGNIPFYIASNALAVALA